MAFDGIVIANLVRDLNEKIASGRISKIAQPEKDELLFTIKGNRENVRLLVSANASLPLRTSACFQESISQTAGSSP